MSISDDTLTEQGVQETTQSSFNCKRTRHSSVPMPAKTGSTDPTRYPTKPIPGKLMSVRLRKNQIDKADKDKSNKFSENFNVTMFLVRPDDQTLQEEFTRPNYLAQHTGESQDDSGADYPDGIDGITATDDSTGVSGHQTAAGRDPDDLLDFYSDNQSSDDEIIQQVQVVSTSDEVHHHQNVVHHGQHHVHHHNLHHQPHNHNFHTNSIQVGPSASTTSNSRGAAGCREVLFGCPDENDDDDDDVVADDADDRLVMSMIGVATAVADAAEAERAAAAATAASGTGTTATPLSSGMVRNQSEPGGRTLNQLTAVSHSTWI